jgi:hypothetical protein
VATSRQRGRMTMWMKDSRAKAFHLTDRDAIAVSRDVREHRSAGKLASSSRRARTSA